MSGVNVDVKYDVLYDCIDHEGYINIMDIRRNELGNRPEWVEQIIDREYAYASSAHALKGYNRNGLQSDYEVLYGSGTGARRILFGDIVEQVAEANDRPLRILSLGAGAGELVCQQLDEGHEAQGVTALDYRQLDGPNISLRPRHELPPESYVVGDVHRLSRMPVHEKADVVESRLCFIHLADPLAVLEDAANRVANGGVLITDEFLFYTSYDDDGLTSAQPIAALQDAGFEPYNPEAAARLERAIRSEGTYIPALVLRRTSDATEVDIPAYYGLHPSRGVRYFSSPHDALATREDS